MKRAIQFTSIRTGQPADRASDDPAIRPDGFSADPSEASLDDELAYAIVTDAPLDVIRELESRIRASVLTDGNPAPSNGNASMDV